MADTDFKDPLQPFTEAYANYQNTLLDTFNPPQLQELYRGAQTKFASAGSDPNQQFEIFRSIAQAVNEVANPRRVSREAEDAYRKFVSGLQGAFANTDPESLTPAHLLAIARGLAVAAFIAASTPSSPS